MSSTMTIPRCSEKRTQTRWISKPDVKLAMAMMSLWPSADALSYDLAEYANIHIVPRTAQKWRNGKTGPSDTDGQKVRKLIKLQAEQRIIALNKHVKAVCNVG